MASAETNTGSGRESLTSPSTSKAKMSEHLEQVVTMEGDSNLELTETKMAADGRTILIPQPSRDANDPLNWSVVKKHVMLVVISAAAFIPEYASSTGAVALVDQAVYWKISEDHVNHSQAGNVFMLGIGGIFSVTLMTYIGRLPVLFWFLVFTFTTSIWCALSTSFASFMAARIVNGFFSAVTQSSAIIFVHDMFFFHERPRKINIWISFVLMGPSLGPMLAAFMLTTQRWQIPFWVIVALSETVLIATVLFGEETFYDRTLSESQQPTPKYRLMRLIGTEQFKTKHLRHTLSETLLRPLKLLRQPTLLIAILYAMMTFSWQVGISTTSAIFLQPLYGFGLKQVGFFYFAPAIGVIIGEIAGHWIHDMIYRYAVRRSGGRFEPEWRLYATYFAVPFLCSGLVQLGLAYGDGLHWIVAAVGWALFMFGSMINTVALNAYMLDIFPHVAGGISAWITFGRNTGGFIISYEQVPWALKDGPKTTFGIQAALCAISLLLMVVVQVYGKRLRSFSGLPELAST